MTDSNPHIIEIIIERSRRGLLASHSARGRMSGPLSRLVVYDGRTPIGELEQHAAPRRVLAFTLTPAGRLVIGTFPDRRSAMRAIEVHSPIPPGAA